MKIRLIIPNNCSFTMPLLYVFIVSQRRVSAPTVFKSSYWLRDIYSQTSISFLLPQRKNETNFVFTLYFFSSFLKIDCGKCLQSLHEVSIVSNNFFFHTFQIVRKVYQLSTYIPFAFKGVKYGLPSPPTPHLTSCLETCIGSLSWKFPICNYQMSWKTAIL